ncbi:DUF6503 family protein [Polaribacter septentrionalilitoris]|uniref:DUF6503 family protein n=1 Tax=Polaribacter septentrionalilitoris TaxID=2494657 RepID=UPI001358D47B|nr:DUF6503 family protein [Polaribacter septentrionalilitoris]
MKYFYLFTLLFLISCNPQKDKILAKDVIDKTIVYSGANKVINSEISFQFRDKKYNAIRKRGSFTLSRSFDSIKDVLSNNGFTRFINDKKVNVSALDSLNYANSVNSVHYFSVLPYSLHDTAVKKRLLPLSTIKGKIYYKIEITFSEEGGGEDHEDVFIYWIGKEDYLIDYLAYSYKTNGGGMRFRALKEQCIVNGVRFVDYHNYKPKIKNIELIDIDKAYENNQLKKVSEIVLKDINVKLLD